MKNIYLYNNERISYIFLNYGILKFNKEIKKNSFVILKSININNYVLSILLNDLKNDNFIIIKSTLLFKIFHKLYSFNIFKNITFLGNFNPSYFHLNIKKISNSLIFNKNFINKKLIDDYKDILNKKYICFSFRDDAYLKKISKKNFSYLSYRNFSSFNLLDALERLSFKKKIFSFRVGKYVNSKLDRTNSFIVDYASKYQNDADDLLLIKNSFLNICDSSGIVYLGHISNQNTLRINCNINDLNHPHKNTMSILVKYFDLINDKYLSYNDAIQRGIMNFTSSSDFKNNKIRIIPNSSEEIFETINFLLSKNIFNTKIDDMIFDHTLNKIFHKTLSKYINDKSNNYFSRYGVKYKSKISEVFLKRNYQLFN